MLVFAFVLGCQKNSENHTSAGGEDNSLSKVLEAGYFQWGADIIECRPFVYEDPEHPGTLIGFEMEIAQGIARHMGVEQKLVKKAWDTLIPELQKGSFDMAMNGIEDTEDRRKIVLFSEPYYVYSQQITVRRETTGISCLKDLIGKRVATLSGTAAEDILRSNPGIDIRLNPETIYSYRDLESGKVDAVLLDKPLAMAYGNTSKLKNVGESFGEGAYVIAIRKEEKSLLKAVNEALRAMKESGELGQILRKYGIMDKYQQKVGIRAI